ncbi:NAD(P)H-hydrate dehydratase [Agarivorans sp. TSD2052]|uniref:NAD(P)H-hydrate dehydratase n=1 Tax=Agarivorans sp. TSD2052 TaxID=2937286 RepID=UPI0020101771|nr:NAD(P)H-hydrate dehydratase [Agarivorans sp. TSD2052]UPW18049.1 NAD(P)H-hydrate dehydratase [Agarivorans sp. TSD2052]
MAQQDDLFSTSLPQSLWRAEVVKNQEVLIAEKQGISLSSLMERAGAASFAYLQYRWPQASKILVLAGGGNNGGDAYVVARLAKQFGIKIQLIELGKIDKLPKEAQLARDAWLAAGGQSSDWQAIDWQYDLIVDGVMGIGISTPLRPFLVQFFGHVNQQALPVLALDIPSGLCANSGRNLGAVIQASATITFIAAKQGLFTGQAANYVGDIVFAGLGLDEQFERDNSSKIALCSQQALSAMLRPRARVSHKGDFGRVVLLGGNIGMAGAIRLAAEACQRVGAGLVRVITKPEHHLVILSGRPELMVTGIEMQQPELLQDALKLASCAVLGPGLGQDEWAKGLFKQALAQNYHSVVDADGLNLLSQVPQRRSNWVLTPHPGEASRLLNCTIGEIEADRMTAAFTIQQRYGGVCVLKGAGTVIAGGNGAIKICNFGNPGMASGGMGDVLSGIIGGLIGQFAAQYSLFEIACLGVSIHSRSADLAAEMGERGMLASDLMPYIRQLVNLK